MKKIALYFFLTIAGGIIGWAFNSLYHSPKTPENIISQVKPRPLDKYTIENLSKADIKPGKFEVGEVLAENEGYTSSVFSFRFDPGINSGSLKKVTGQVNIPEGPGPFPVVLMLRGYVNQKNYKTGDGTRRGAEIFAKNGFVTLAPDFLGYGGSDPEAGNIFESRFQTYVTVLSLLKTLRNNELTKLRTNDDPIRIWAHSNGGQVALTVLEITGGEYPTVLWAPVSKPFPYSILYYTDESDDRGKLIRRELASFEETYDVELYSLTNYLDRIKATIQLHQGTADEAVPKAWSDSLSKSLLALNLDLDYFVYPGSDHNLQPTWNTTISRSLSFFKGTGLR